MEHFLLAPLGAAWDVTITSAFRNGIDNGGLYALDPKRAARKAKGVSQHVLAEAIDFTIRGADLRDCFTWCLAHLRPFQAILEYHEGRPECIHLSLPSEIDTIAAKRLLFIDPPGPEIGHYENFTGAFPEAA